MIRNNNNVLCCIPCSFRFSETCKFFVDLFCWLVLVFEDRVSLCSHDCPVIHSVDQAGLKLRDNPASASQVLGQRCVTLLPSLEMFLKISPAQEHAS